MKRIETLSEAEEYAAALKEFKQRVSALFSGQDDGSLVAGNATKEPANQRNVGGNHPVERNLLSLNDSFRDAAKGFTDHQHCKAAFT